MVQTNKPNEVQCEVDFRDGGVTRGLPPEKLKSSLQSVNITLGRRRQECLQLDERLSKTTSFLWTF